MVSMYEGAIKKGRCNAKFGRLLTREGDNFIGYLTGDPATGEWGAIGKGVWYADLRLQAMGMYNTTLAAGLPFEAATDLTDTEDFVWWYFYDFAREDIPYDVLYDYESGCMWRDTECLYYAYRHNAWGADKEYPEWILENPYYQHAEAYANFEPPAEDDEEMQDDSWDRPDYGDDWDTTYDEEEFDEEAWEDYEIDYFPTDEWEYDLEDLGVDFYDLAGERNETANHTSNWTAPSDEYDFDRPSEEDTWDYDFEDETWEGEEETWTDRKSVV